MTKRSENYSSWYNVLVVKADLAEQSDVRGCMVIKPYGYAIWEKMQRVLDDKFKETGLTAITGPVTGCPMVAESPVNLECKVKEVKALGSHDMFLAEVVAVHVSEDYMEGNGRFCLNQTGLVAYSHGEYFSLGKKLGTFGYSVRKPAKKKGKHRR